MRDQVIIHDPLNLRDSILFITGHIRQLSPSDQSPKNILGFLTALFDGIDFDGKGFSNSILTIQKVFSGNLPFSKIDYITSRVLSGQMDAQLLTNIQKILSVICRSPDRDDFFRRLSDQLSLRFFEKEELEVIRRSYACGDYTAFVLGIVKHGFQTLYNLPCFFATRMYEEALTYDFDSPFRFELMRVAAEKGNKDAALEYGNYLSKHGPYSEAFLYLLMAVPLPAAIWNLAYLIENHLVEPEQVHQFKELFRLEEKLNSPDFDDFRRELDQVICTATDSVHYNNLTCAYRTYFYLAYKGFHKGFNSMAKLLGTHKMDVIGERSGLSRMELDEKYRNLAIRGSNVVAMCNASSQLLKQHTDPTTPPLPPEEQEYMLELLESSAGMNLARAYYNFGLYYEHAAESSAQSQLTKESIASFYERALELNVEGASIQADALYRLGRLQSDPAKKKDYFQKALSKGNPDVAYSLALVLYEEYSQTGQPQSLLRARAVLAENLAYMTAPVKDQSLLLWQNLECSEIK